MKLTTLFLLVSFCAFGQRNELDFTKVIKPVSAGVERYAGWNAAGQPIVITPGAITVGWGSISGTLSNQTDLQNALNAKQATLVSGTNLKTVEGTSLLGSGNLDITKTDIGLSNVDNTSDLNKPISTLTQAALDAKAGGTGTANGTNTGDQTTITGNAGTATALQNSRNINGVAFNGTANVTVPAMPQSATTTGGTTTYVLTPTIAATAYTAGDVYNVVFNAQNTGASTINISGLGAKNMMKGQSTALASGELITTKVYDLVYDGTNFQVRNFGALPTGTVSPVYSASPTFTGTVNGAGLTLSGNPTFGLTKVLTLGGNLTTSGAFASTFTMSGTTTVTFPTTGTLSAIAGTENLSNKTFTDKLRGTVAANTGFGTQALTGGTATISNTSVTASSLIFLTSVVDGGVPGFCRVTARSAGVSFTITSSNVADTSTIAYIIIN